MIAKERYTSPEYLRAELEHVFPNSWLMAGFAADLPGPGSYFTFEIGSESILVVRQAEGVRAFHNVCLHRGRRLRELGIGRARSFPCAYHGWEWGTDGKLLNLPDADRFPKESEGRPCKLNDVRSEEWAGFIWVNPSGKAPPLAEFLGPIKPLIEAYHLEDYALVEDQTMEVPFNWKVCVDAFNEVYHLRFVHPEIMGVVDDVPVQTSVFGRHGRLVTPFFVPSSRKQDRTEIDGALRWFLEEAGVSAAEATGSALDVRQKVQASIRARERAGVINTAALTDEQLVDNNHFHVFPNLQLDLYSLKMQVLRSRPHPTDPGRMLFDQLRFDRIPKGKERPRRPTAEKLVYGKGSLGTVTDQDLFNLARVQLGMQSSGFPGIVTGDQELLIEHLHRTLDGYMPGTT